MRKYFFIHFIPTLLIIISSCNRASVNPVLPKTDTVKKGQQRDPSGIDTLTIDKTKDVTKGATIKDVSQDKNISVLTTKTNTHDADIALLKNNLAGLSATLAASNKTKDSLLKIMTTRINTQDKLISSVNTIAVNAAKDAASKDTVRIPSMKLISTRNYLLDVPQMITSQVAPINTRLEAAEKKLASIKK